MFAWLLGGLDDLGALLEAEAERGKVLLSLLSSKLAGEVLAVVVARASEGEELLGLSFGVAGEYR